MLINGVLLEGLEDVLDLLERGSERIIIEAPTGLRGIAVEVSKMLGSGRAMVSGRNAWGSCDISPTPGASIIHIGHALPPNIEGILRMNGASVDRGGGSIIIKYKDSTVYLVPAYYEPDPEVEKALIGRLRQAGAPKLIAYALPYKLYADRLATALGARLFGPFTGCFFPLKVDDAGVVAGGLFYSMTVKLVNPSARVLAIDPHRIAVEDIDREYRRFLAIKVGALIKAREAKRVAVIVTGKPGQSMERRVNDVLAYLGNNGIDSFLVYGDEVGPDLINELSVDAVINTACPRLGFDDLDRINKPVINMGEIKYLRSGLEDYLSAKVLAWPGDAGK